jgi:hypothetical protein
MTFNTNGEYNPAIVQNTVLTGTTPTIVLSHDFQGPQYHLYYATLTIRH